MTNKNQHITLL